MKYGALILLVLAVLTSRGASLELQLGNVFWQGSPGGYDPFDAESYPYLVNFSVRRLANGPNTFFVAFSRGNASDYNRQLQRDSDRLAYQIYKDSSLTTILKDAQDATLGEVISAVVPGPQERTIPLSFVMHIPAGQILQEGSFTDVVLVSLYSGTLIGSNQLQATAAISFSATVVGLATLAIVPSGSSFTTSSAQTLDFGTLNQGKELGCDILVRHNAECRLDITSENLGKLKPLGPAVPGEVPYSFLLSGLALDLAKPQTYQLPGVTSPPTGTRLPVSVIIGSTLGATAGRYRDIITVTVHKN